MSSTEWGPTGCRQVESANAAMQQQPPLDALFNAAAQRLVGIGDFRQRALSVALGIASIGLLGSLILRGRLRLWSVVGAIYLATSPLWISVVADARPYALALFLMMLFLVGVTSFLDQGGRWRAVGVASVDHDEYAPARRFSSARSSRARGIGCVMCT